MKELIKKALCGEDYRKNAKKYVVNMTSSKKRLHIKDTKCCYPSKFIQEYLDFDSEKEAFEFFKKYEKDLYRCDNCFNIKNNHLYKS